MNVDGELQSCSLSHILSKVSHLDFLLEEKRANQIQETDDGIVQWKRVFDAYDSEKGWALDGLLNPLEYGE